MTTNINEFVVGLERFKSLPPKQIEKIMKEAGTFALKRVVELTPVDTGRLVSSWNMALNVPNYNTTPLGRRQADSARQTALKTGAVIAQVKLGDVIYISNGVEYANYVENGTPDMSPAYMMRQTVMELQRRLQSLK